jgi:hypothetical protein
MSDAHPRHRFGGNALILAFAAVLLSGFAFNATWATVESDRHIEPSGPFSSGEVNITFEAAIQLREMEIDIYSAGPPGSEYEAELHDTETHEENADRGVGSMKSTFEDLDSAGLTAQWLLILGLIFGVLSIVLTFANLAGWLQPLPALVAGGVGFALLLGAPIVWYLMLPSDGVFINPFLQFEMTDIWSGETAEPLAFEPSPAYGLFLALGGGAMSLASAVCILLMYRAESTEEKPGWMLPREGDVLPAAPLSGFLIREGGEVRVDFSRLELSLQKLAMPIGLIVVMIILLLSQSMAWSTYEIQPEGDSKRTMDLYLDEIVTTTGSDESRLDYDASTQIEAYDDMGAANNRASWMVSIAFWMLAVGLLWRFAVACGFAQRVPGLCRRNAAIDTGLLTGGLLLAFLAPLIYLLTMPDQAAIFPAEEYPVKTWSIRGGSNMIVWIQMLLLAPAMGVTFLLGAHGATSMAFLHSKGIPIPGLSEASDSGSETGEGMTFVNPFKDPRVTSLPWLMILGVTFTLIIASAGGFMVYKLVVPDPVPPVSRDPYYQNSSRYFGNGSDSETVFVQDGQTQTVTYTAMEYDLSSNYSMLRLVVVLDYAETDIDPTCDDLEATFSLVPAGLDTANSTLSGTVSDCSQIELSAYIERGMEGVALDGTQANLSVDERNSLLEYYNDHILGIGEWAVDITVNDQGPSPFENGEDVDVYWYIEQVSLTLEPV